jgi:hypothetical protein
MSLSISDIVGGVKVAWWSDGERVWNQRADSLSVAIRAVIPRWKVPNRRQAARQKVCILSRISHKIKVVVQFKATGNAPIMKQNKFKISAHQRFGSVADFLRKQLRVKPGDTLVRDP